MSTYDYNNGLKEGLRDMEPLRAEITRLRELVGEMAEELRRHGHGPACPLDMRDPQMIDRCTCGLVALLARAREVNLG